MKDYKWSLDRIREWPTGEPFDSLILFISKKWNRTDRIFDLFYSSNGNPLRFIETEMKWAALFGWLYDDPPIHLGD
jgi:hypothetical protein